MTFDDKMRKLLDNFREGLRPVTKITERDIGRLLQIQPFGEPTEVGLIVSAGWPITVLIDEKTWCLVSRLDAKQLFGFGERGTEPWVLIPQKESNGDVRPVRLTWLQPPVRIDDAYKLPGTLQAEQGKKNKGNEQNKENRRLHARRHRPDV